MIQFNTYQAIAITDGSQSYAVYTYRCGHLQWSGGATIGYNGGPVGNFYANHPRSGSDASTIACLNAGITEWSNVVYNVSCEVCIATEPPPTVEPREMKPSRKELGVKKNCFFCTAQEEYLEFLGRTNNSITMRRCDDCSSDAIDLTASPVPFGDYFHYVAHVSFALKVILIRFNLFYRSQLMDLFHLDNISQISLQTYSPMKMILRCSPPLWLHLTGETSTTETLEKFGMRHMNLDRVQLLTYY